MRGWTRKVPVVHLGRLAVDQSVQGGLAHGVLASIYAICPDASFRDGDKAVVHASLAVKIACSQRRDWGIWWAWAALAAAYAERGEFDFRETHGVDAAATQLACSVNLPRPCRRIGQGKARGVNPPAFVETLVLFYTAPIVRIGQLTCLVQVMLHIAWHSCGDALAGVIQGHKPFFQV
jgi:hypothetical protein